MSEVGLRVAELRRLSGWTQQNLADKLGCEIVRVWRIEAGKANLTLKSLSELSRIFDVDAAELFEAPKSNSRRRRGRPKKR